MEILAETTATAVINSGIQRINLAEWLFSLSDADYQACSTQHIAAGATLSPEGKRMSINVERIGENLLVQHYVEEVSTPEHCRVKSVSDSISPLGAVKMGVTWELSVKPIDENSCSFKNHVTVHSTAELLAALNKAGLTDMSAVKAGMLKNATDHNNEETPLFALDIERKANAGIWVYKR